MTMHVVWDGQPATAVVPARQVRGQQAYQSGLAAEESVARDYGRRGRAVAARRWRGASGEIDLILQDGDGFIFVEVKQARTHDQAAERLSRRQMARIGMAAQEFIDTCPKRSLTDMRFDLALVDGAGQVKVIENLYLGD